MIDATQQSPAEQKAFYEWKERHRIDLKEFIPGTAMSFMVQR